MSDDVVTAAELETMTPEQRDTHFDASIVRDIASAPEEIVERALAHVRRHIATNEHDPS